jgi:phosphohistidine phosphatase
MIMKTLFVVRHAKSDWSHEGLSDFERPLNKRGRHDAPLMGSVLGERGAKPALIRASAATRAITTARLLAESLSISPDEVVADTAMYGAGPLELLDVVAGFDDDITEAMLVGHNPTMHMLAYRLCGFDEDNLPTCGIVCIDLEMDSWADVHGIRGKLRYYEYPKKHR